MSKYCLNYDSGEYEYISEDGYSYDQGEYVYNWDNSECQREEERRREEEDDEYYRRRKVRRAIALGIEPTRRSNKRLMEKEIRRNEAKKAFWNKVFGRKIF